ncbi:orotidine-5'-phosphate decarboxylase, partial [Candidatus Aminicenantes bacterium AC-334-K16]|nr:orotidine-5'-phosphate decarboxylase [Candidatus Aminicenantes bacterium AC-334-K16]
RTQALKLIDLLPQSRIFKVGLRLFVAEGPALVQEIISRGKEVFLDLKLHDIPNTVAQAVGEAAKLGVRMITIHTSGGKEMMKKAVEVLNSLPRAGAKARPLLLGVTVLTSQSSEDLEEIGLPTDPASQVLRLAQLAVDCGLDGLVCSPQEVEAVKRITRQKMVLITPGIRPSWSTQDDQKRIMTPQEALQKGADFLVIGRPIIAAPQPDKAFWLIVEEIKSLSDGKKKN